MQVQKSTVAPHPKSQLMAKLQLNVFIAPAKSTQLAHWHSRFIIAQK
jgi:hypothetical protein